MQKPRPARCPTCGSEELLTVIMRPQGDAISFTSCNACGWRRWGRGKELVRLSSVRPFLRTKRGRSTNQQSGTVVRLPAAEPATQSRQPRRARREDGPVIRELKSLRRR